MLGELILLGVLPVLLLLAAGFDLASYTIPNLLSLALMLAFFVFAIVIGLTWASIGLHVGVALLGLAVGFVLFSLKLIGGGDAKLFAAILLWFGLHDVANFAVIASIFGGALTLALLGLRYVPLPELMLRQAWIAKLHSPQSGIPYGVALAIGGCVVLPYSEIFRLAGA